MIFMSFILLPFSMMKGESTNHSFVPLMMGNFLEVNYICGNSILLIIAIKVMNYLCLTVWNICSKFWLEKHLWGRIGNSSRFLKFDTFILDFVLIVKAILNDSFQLIKQVRYESHKVLIVRIFQNIIWSWKLSTKVFFLK